MHYTSMLMDHYAFLTSWQISDISDPQTYQNLRHLRLTVRLNRSFWSI